MSATRLAPPGTSLAIPGDDDTGRAWGQCVPAEREWGMYVAVFSALTRAVPGWRRACWAVWVQAGSGWCVLDFWQLCCRVLALFALCGRWQGPQSKLVMAKNDHNSQWLQQSKLAASLTHTNTQHNTVSLAAAAMEADQHQRSQQQQQQHVSHDTCCEGQQQQPMEQDPQQPPVHPQHHHHHQPQHPTAAPPPQPQQRQRRQQRTGAAHEEEQRAAGNVDQWWLSESEGSGDDDDAEEQQMLAKPADPLYDPAADDADEAWAVQQRSGRTTDAILSCPGCFATLSIDCQQHALYHTQYRAMFVQNCEVKADVVVRTQVQQRQQQQQQQGRHNRKRRADAAVGAGAGPPDESQQQEEEELLHPVCCAVCGTEVGAQDADEVVHFYQVLASEC